MPGTSPLLFSIILALNRGNFSSEQPNSHILCLSTMLFDSYVIIEELHDER